MNRRSFLTMLGATPITAPALAQAALTPDPLLSATSLGTDEAYAAALARYHSELDAWAEGVQAWRESPIPALPQSPALPGTAVARFDSRSPLPAVATCPFTDDVGSGP